MRRARRRASLHPRGRDLLPAELEGCGISDRDVYLHLVPMFHCDAGYKCPTSVEFRTALARTATGKLQKYKLREPFWVGMARQVN